MKPFCNSCGLCCARVGAMVEQAKAIPDKTPFVKAIADFPYKYDSTGRCENLSEDNLCKVYATRPLVCSIEQMYRFYKKEFTREEFYAINKEACIKIGAMG